MELTIKNTRMQKGCIIVEQPRHMNIVGLDPFWKRGILVTNSIQLFVSDSHTSSRIS